MSRLSLLLLVDPDPKGLETLTYGFEREGCTVTATSDTMMAPDLIRTTSPQLVIVAIRDPATPSLNLLRGLRDLDRTRQLPVVAIGAEGLRGAAAESGGMDFLVTPVFVRDVITIGKMLVDLRDQRAPEGDDPTVRGHLADYGLFYIVRAMAGTRRSGILQLYRGNRSGEVRFCEGEVTSAQVGSLQGFAAFHHLLLWEQAALELKFRPVLRRGQFPMKAEELLEEGERFLRDFAAAAKGLGSAQTVLAPDLARIAETSGSVPAEVGPVVRLFDGQRSLGDVIEDSPFRIFDTLRIVTRLVEIGALAVQDAAVKAPGGSMATVSKPALDDWLQKSRPPPSETTEKVDGARDGNGGGADKTAVATFTGRPTARQRTITASGIPSFGRDQRGGGGNRRKTTRRERALDRLAAAARPMAAGNRSNGEGGSLGQVVARAAQDAAAQAASAPSTAAPGVPAAPVADTPTAPVPDVHARGEIRATKRNTPAVGNGPSVVIDLGPSPTPPSQAIAAPTAATGVTIAPPARVRIETPTRVKTIEPPPPRVSVAASAAAPIAARAAGSIEIDPALLAEMQALEAAQRRGPLTPPPAPVAATAVVAPAAPAAKLEPSSVVPAQDPPAPAAPFHSGAGRRVPNSGRTRLSPGDAFNDIEADFFAREADLYKKEKVENFDDLDRKTDPGALRRQPIAGFHSPNPKKK